MKYKTFRNLLAGGVVSAGVAGGAGYVAMQDDAPETVVDPAPRDPPPRDPEPQPRPLHPADVTPPVSGDDPRAVVEALLLARLGKPGSGKMKDVLPSSPVKANLYADGDHYNRAKVDLDRDGKWDEKWTFKEGRVDVQYASNDDENYDQTRVAGLAAPETANPQAPPAGLEAAPGLRAVDKDLLRLRTAGITGKKAKDATRGRAYKVNLYSDSGQGDVNRAKVDLDRDDKWDEKWTFKGEGVERQVAPRDDEKYSETWELTAGGWKKK